MQNPNQETLHDAVLWCWHRTLDNPPFDEFSIVLKHHMVILFLGDKGAGHHESFYPGNA
jgi:hypothetical protein